MRPRCEEFRLLRAAGSVLVCACLLPGCMPNPARPIIDLPPALPPSSAAAQASGPVASDGPAPATAVSYHAGKATWASNGEGGAGLTTAVHPAYPLVSFTLPEAIDYALQNNPRLRSAVEAVERARGEESVAFAPFLPQIDLLNRYVATGKSTVPGAPGPTGVVNVTGIGDYQVAQSELQLQWTLYDFGRTAGRYGQAEMREKIAELQTVRARETVAYDVSAAYLQALEAAAFRRIAAETVRRAEAVLEDVRARQAGGVALKDDVLRGEVELSESRDAQVRADDAEITALARLNNVMGRDASLPLRFEEVQPPGRFTASLAECLGRAAAERPEVGVARDRVAVAQFGRKAAKGEFLPELKIKGSLGRIEGENVVGGWQEGVGISLNVPLYHGDANRGNLRAAEADIRRAVADAQGVLNDISMEVVVAHRAVLSAQRRVELARPAVEQSVEALRILRERYRNGTATPTDVIGAETASTRAAVRFATARIDYLSALARLAYVMGYDPGGLCGLLAGPEPGGSKTLDSFRQRMNRDATSPAALR